MHGFSKWQSEWVVHIFKWTGPYIIKFLDSSKTLRRFYIAYLRLTSIDNEIYIEDRIPSENSENLECGSSTYI